MGDEPSLRARLSSVLTVVLLIVLVVAIAATVYVALFPPETSPPFTEYYLTGPDGNASGYPTDLEPGATGDLIVGVSNHEHESVTYRTVVTWNGTTTQEFTVTVPDGETRERRLTITAPGEPGRYEVRFNLYDVANQTASEPKEWTRLWVTVGNTNGSTASPGNATTVTGTPG